MGKQFIITNSPVVDPFTAYSRENSDDKSHTIVIKSIKVLEYLHMLHVLSSILNNYQLVRFIEK